MVPERQRDRTWVYPPIGVALAMLGLEEIRVYIARHQNTVVQCIATSPIMDFCLEAEQKTGMRLSRQWWKKPTLDTMGIRVGQAALEGGGRIVDIPPAGGRDDRSRNAGGGDLRLLPP